MQEKVRALEMKIENERRNAESVSRKASDAERGKLREIQNQLEKALRTQIEETKKEKQLQERKRRMQDLLEAQITEAIPLINEVNAMSVELEKSKEFSIQLVANHSKAMSNDVEDESANTLETDVWIKVKTENCEVPQMWIYEKFTNRLYLMREMYQDFVECGRNMTTLDSNYNENNDPFYDPPDESLIGNAYVMLDSLYYFLNIEDMPPIINYKGKTDGVLQVAVSLDETEVENFDDVDGEEETTFKDIIGETLKFTITIAGAKGIPRSLRNNVNVSYKFFTSNHRTVPCQSRTINPKFNDTFQVKMPITEEFVTFINKEALEFQVWGTSDQVIESKAPLNIEQQQEKERKEKASALEEAKNEGEQNVNKIKSKVEEELKAAASKVRILKEQAESKEMELKQRMMELENQLSKRNTKVEDLESKIKVLESTIELTEQKKSSTCIIS
uniref:Kinesin-like KIF1-type domain-containing protein n=1 Tax=Aplanochytrium stocchinoi TaxID=215587 RepID=A0A7S3PKQ7_9STRA